MTEAQWLACREPGAMLTALGNYASERKMRLYACACCRRMGELLPDPRCRAALEVAERFADDLASAKELEGAARSLLPLIEAARHRCEGPQNVDPDSTVWFFRADADYTAVTSLQAATSPFLRIDNLRADYAVAQHAAERGGAFEPALRAEEEAHAELLRDLFNEWFRPVVPHPEWFTSDVMALATHLYDNHAFEHLPILADALQDAGCDSDDVLNHCRDNGLHARGCWAVDLVLGKV